MKVSACTSGQIWWFLGGLCCLYSCRITFCIMHTGKHFQRLHVSWTYDQTYAHQSLQKLQYLLQAQPNVLHFLHEKFTSLDPKIDQINRLYWKNKMKRDQRVLVFFGKNIFQISNHLKQTKYCTFNLKPTKISKLICSLVRMNSLV